MANTLTNLTPELYDALDIVSREMVGMIPAVARDSNASRAALNQTVRIHQAPAATALDLSASQLPADNGDNVFTNTTISITKERYVPVRWNGDEQRSMNSGPGYNAMLRDQFAQAMRTLSNEIEADLAGLYIRASRAVAPTGTNLFDASLKDIANARRILGENGSPMGDIQCVLNHAAGATLRGLSQYAGANTAGADDIIRQGILLNTYGVNIRESGQIITHTNGDYNSLGVIDAVEPIGETSISVDVAGTGGVLPGDVVSEENSVGGDLYVVSTANADLDSGNCDINAPGLVEATAGATNKLELNASLDRNMMFDRNAIQLITRVPSLPEEGDSAVDRMVIEDPHSGMAFEVSKYLEHRRVKYEIALAWGFAAIKPEHIALLID